jgi:hypothetical protein
MLVVVAAFMITKALDAIASNKKCSRSPLHRAAAFPLQQLRMLSELSALKMFLEALGQDAFFSAIVN